MKPPNTWLSAQSCRSGGLAVDAGRGRGVRRMDAGQSRERCIVPGRLTDASSSELGNLVVVILQRPSEHTQLTDSGGGGGVRTERGKVGLLKKCCCVEQYHNTKQPPNSAVQYSAALRLEHQSDACTAVARLPRCRRQLLVKQLVSHSAAAALSAIGCVCGVTAEQLRRVSYCERCLIPLRPFPPLSRLQRS